MSDPALLAAINKLTESNDKLQRSIDRMPQSGGNRTQSGGRSPAFTSGASTDALVGQNSKISASFAKMSEALERFGNLGASVYGGLEEFGEFGRAKYDAIQEQFGGIRDIGNAATETAAKSVEAFDDIYSTFYGNQAAMGDLAIEVNGKNVNALTAFYKDVAELGDNYLEIRGQLANRQSIMFNKMSREDVQKLTVMEKGLQISNQQVAKLLERQISTTGEASTKIFDEIGAYADSVSKATGVSFQEISGQITDIITDVSRFGNVQVEEAARIAGALNQLGLSYEGFGGMVDKFMNFDNAAESLGNLTTVFGVHFDAMEMMQLANEDQEEFLHRMRDAFLDSGKAVEDMTLAEKKLASQQMGMSIQDFENFMQEDRELTDLTAATDAADPSDGFEAMTKNMTLVNRSGDEMQQHMINKVMDPISKQAYTTGNDIATMKANLVLNPEKYLPGYEKFATELQGSIKGMTGTDEFSTMYTDKLAQMKAILAMDAMGAENIDAFNKEIDKFLDDAKKNAEDQVKMSEFIDLAMSQNASAEIQAKMLSAIGQSAIVGAESSAKGFDVVKEKTEAGVKIDPVKLSTEIKKQFDEMDKNIETQLAAEPLNIFGQSPSPAVGQRIQEGVSIDVEVAKSNLLSQLDEVSSSVTSVFESKGVLGGESETKITVQTPDLIKDLQEINEKVLLKSEEIKKSSDEKADNLISIVETFLSAFGKFLETPQVIDNKLEIDSITLARQLMKVKTPEGTSFSLVNQGGDSV